MNRTIAIFVFAVAVTSTVLTARASTFTIDGSVNSYTITRSGDTSVAETVQYRTVPLSAFPGQHYTATNGVLVFAPGQTSTNVYVSVSSPSADAYKYQSGTSRSYRFELTDRAGALLASKDGSVSSGLASVPSSGAFDVKDLVITNGTITVTDGGYGQAYHSVPVSSYYNAAAPKNYLAAVGATLRMTVTFDAREGDDGYQYVQIYANTPADDDHTDTGAKNGNPGDYNYARYAAGFTIDGNVSSTYYPYTFPLTSAGHNCGAQAHPWSGNSNGNLEQQFFQSNCRASDGRLIVPTSLTSLYIRLNASGNFGDTWYAKNVKAHIQAVDSTKPTKLADPVVAPGPYRYGTTFYVSIPFSEIVTVSGTPTLHTDWGDLSYFFGSGSNVLTFQGTIGADFGVQLIVRTLDGAVTDLAGNAFSTAENNVYKAFSYTVDYPWPGSGTEADPYVITTTNQLGYLAARVNAAYGDDDFAGKYFVLAADLDYGGTSDWDRYPVSTSGNNFTPVGCFGRSFKGHFDGQGHTVSGIRLDKQGADEDERSSVGLFGFVSGGSVRNIVLRESKFQGDRNVGGIVGYLSGGTVTNCTLYHVLVGGATKGNAAGLGLGAVAGHQDGTITDCYFRDCRIGTTKEERVGTTSSYVLHNDRVDNVFAVTPAADVSTAFVSGESVTIDGATYYTAGSTVALGYTGIVPENWILSYAATGGAAVNGATLTIASADTTVSASVMPITYTVRFDAPDADTGSMPDQTLTYDTPQALTSNVFTRAGYAFAGWRGADGTIYPDGAIVLNLTNAQNAVVSFAATWRIAIPYIDADGNEQMCTDYTVLTNAACDVEYGESGAANWYVVTNAVTVGGQLYLRGTTRLILCDGATLTVTNANGIAINAYNLTIYGQENGTGAIVATGDNRGIAAGSVTINGGSVTATGCDIGIYASRGATINGGSVTATGNRGIYCIDGTATINGGSVTATGGTYGIDASHVTINGGSVTATGNNGISAGSVAINGGSVTAIGGTGIVANRTITLGWTNPDDSIYASRYSSQGGRVTVNGSLTDGGNIYSGSVNVSDLAGKTLRPAITYTVRFDANGGTGTMADQTFVYATPQALASNAFTRIGYDFAGWSTNANGAVVYSDGASVSNLTAEANKTVTFYAQWAAHTYTFRFDTGADGVTGAMPDQTFAYDARQALTSNAFTRTGYTFAGWRGADGSIYPDGATVIVRYAYHKEGIWKHFDRMPYPGKSNADYRPGDGAIQNTDGDNGVNLYTGFENCAWDPTNPALAAIISANAAWFDEHDARYGVSMKLIEDFPNFYIPNFYIEQVDDAQGGVVTLSAIWLPHVPYIDADGNEQMCTDYTVLTNAAGDVEYVEWWGESWYVVTNDVTISGNLWFTGVTNHLILCDGATLTVTNANGTAIGTSDNLAIYCQANGTGMLIVNGSDDGIFAWDNVIINGGSITATGGNGIYANGDIILGWTNPTDSITASSYNGRVSVKSGQVLTDGSNIYGSLLGTSLSALADKMLRPAYSITLPEGVVAGGVVTQDGTTAYARPGDTVTLRAAAPGYVLGNVTVNGDALEPVGGVYSFAASAASITVTAATVMTQWQALQMQLDAGGAVTLANDVTAMSIDSPLTVTNAVTLDLNGHVIDADGWFRVIEVLEGGNLTLTNSVEGAGAVIGGCDVYYGGGVYVNEGGAFTMAGGTISENAVTGGTYGGDAPRGGGVYVDGGTFTMTGGTICSNKVSKTAGHGGGVYVVDGAFTMNGGIIIDNDACQGGGVYMDDVAFEMTGGSISNNYAAKHGGGVCANKCTVTISGGEISGNVVGPSSGTIGGGGVYVYSSSNSDRSTFTMTGGEISGNVVYASGSTDVYGGGGVYVNEYGTFAMTGGSIISNSVQSSGRAYGGGVCLKNNSGTGTMTGGTISGNFVDTTGDGGSIYAAGGGMFVNKCAFTMSGGEISGNWSSKNGGGVAVGGIGYAFVMTGGEISGNTAKCLGIQNIFGGGGVYVNNNATFAMTNSVVSGNVASKGGGVFVNNGTFKVSGVSVVSGNTNSVGAAANVYLPSGKEIAVDGLSADASIGVTTAVRPTESLPLTFATGAVEGDETYFFSDNPAYHAEYANGEVSLVYGMVYPAYLYGAKVNVTNNWVGWAEKYGANTNAAYEGHFLLGISPATAIPEGAALLKVVDFGITNKVLHLELASDYAPLFQPLDPDGDPDPTLLCNGYAMLELATGLAAFASPAETIRMPVPVAIDATTGRASVDFDLGEFLALLYPEVPQAFRDQVNMPSALFIRSAITTIYPDDYMDFLYLLVAEP